MPTPYCKQPIAKRASLIRFARRKRDVPDVGLAADVEHIDDVLVVDALIAADNNSLIWIKLREFLELLQQILGTLLLTIDNDCSVGRHIHNDLTNVRLLFVGFGRRRHFDVQLVLAEREVPGHDEKHQNDQQNIDHWRDHEPQNARFRMFTKIHFRSTKPRRLPESGIVLDGEAAVAT